MIDAYYKMTLIIPQLSSPNHRSTESQCSKNLLKNGARVGAFFKLPHFSFLPFKKDPWFIVVNLFVCMAPCPTLVI
jgi:hypothetical protein